LLPTHVKSPIGSPFIILPEVDSTNRYAKNQIDTKMADHGTVYFAHHQLEGKGRMGKRWASEPGKNILMSVVINTSLQKNRSLPGLNQWVSVACYDFLSQYAGEETRIKWPNDLYWRDRKAGGILIENTWRGNLWNWAIIGIGLNINQSHFEEGAGQPVSLQQITGNVHQPVELAKELFVLLERRYQQWVNQQEAEILEAYNQHLYKKSQWVNFVVNGKVLTGMPIAVNDAGELVIKDEKGLTQCLTQAQWLQ
jgi:BirA family biotin operon repressor/biotin-[acetyl-CoA-carboxylase] ligase